jgi:hypothetical protein
MTQFNAPVIRRAGGELDVYTALLCVAFLVLLAGTVLLAMRNMDHSKVDANSSGGVITLVPRSGR